MNTNTIKPADIVFVMHHDNKLSKAIAWFMNSRWSHSAIVADVTERDVYLHETSDTQTKVGMLSRYLNSPGTEVEIWSFNMLSKTEQSAAISESAKYHDKMYGYIRLLGAGLRRLLIKIGFKKAPMLLPIGGPLCMMIPHAGLKKIYPQMPTVGTIDTEELYKWVKDRAILKLYKPAEK